MSSSTIVGEFSVLSPSQKRELEQKRREKEARETAEAIRRAEAARKVRETAQRAAAAKKMAAEEARQKLAEKIQETENAKSAKIAVLIIVGIAATVFLIWSFVKLYNLFDGFVIFVLYGGIMWIGGIILLWVLVKVAIEEVIEKYKRKIKDLKGEW